MKRNRTRRASLLFAQLEPRTLFSAIATSTDLTASTTSLLVGETITFTATVTPDSGPSLNGQWVQLWDAGTVFVASAQLTNNVATLTWSPRSGGLHVISAEFPAQDNDQRSISGDLNINVFRRLALLDLQTATTNIPGVVQLTVTASSFDALPFAPAGNVQLFDGPQLLGTVNLTSANSLIVALPPGPHNFTALYSGDAAFFPAQASNALVVTAVNFPAPITIALPPALDIMTTSKLNLTFSSPAGPSFSDPTPTAVSHHSTLPPEFRQFYEFHLPPALPPDARLQIALASNQYPATP